MSTCHSRTKFRCWVTHRKSCSDDSRPSVGVWKSCELEAIGLRYCEDECALLRDGACSCTASKTESTAEGPPSAPGSGMVLMNRDSLTVSNTSVRSVCVTVPSAMSLWTASCDSEELTVRSVELRWIPTADWLMWGWTAADVMSGSVTSSPAGMWLTTLPDLTTSFSGSLGSLMNLNEEYFSVKGTFTTKLAHLDHNGACSTRTRSNVSTSLRTRTPFPPAPTWSQHTRTLAHTHAHVRTSVSARR